MNQFKHLVSQQSKNGTPNGDAHAHVQEDAHLTAFKNDRDHRPEPTEDDDDV